LPKRIFTELHINYGGHVRGLSLPAFLQMVGMEALSCTLQINTKGERGRLSLIDGELVAAKVGKLRGEPAALKILAWQNVLIDIDYSLKEIRREINKPLMGLLLDSGRLIDEKLSARPNLRKDDRLQCLVAVEYDMGDWTYQCYLQDISLGGVYIETAQFIEIGKEIDLMLASPTLKRRCTIAGKVVRRDKNGIGVCFSTLNAEQKEVIQALTTGSPVVF